MLDSSILLEYVTKKVRKEVCLQWRSYGGAARPGCHSLGGDTQSMDQYLQNDTNGT